jgi:putative transcriptional regulator
MKNLVKVERAKLNITQQELADKISVSRQTINSIETQKYIPSTVIADAFNTNVNAIFVLEEGD